MTAPPAHLPIAWQPLPGFQMRACQQSSFETLLGGAAGPGKTSILIALAAKYAQHPAARGIFFRTVYKDTLDVRDRMQALYPKLGASWSVADSRWRFPSGGTVQVAHAKSRTDIEDYLGPEYCVAAGTRVRMADGTLQAIERIQTGDSVMTLEGPHRVVATYAGMRKPCVRADLLAADGEVIASQEHPVWHPVLRADGSGWDSYASVANDRSADTASSVHSGAPVPPLALFVRAMHVAPLSLSVLASHDDRQTATECRAPRKWSAQEQPSFPAHHTAEGGGHAPLLARAGSVQGYSVGTTAYETAYARPDSERAADSQYCCPSPLRFRDARPLGPSNSVRDVAPLRAGVASQGHSGHTEDGSDSTAIDSPACDARQYTHPYTNERRQQSLASGGVALRMTPVGDRDVYDLTIETANHYITESGLVNKNTFVLWDEISLVPEEVVWQMILGRIRSTDPTVPLRARASANPVGIGRGWVRERFVVPCGKQGKTVYTDAESGRTRAYVPGTANDNPLLPPSYWQGLADLPPSVTLALKNGDWDLSLGLFYPELLDQADAVFLDKTPPLLDWYEYWGGFDWGFSHPAAFGQYVRIPSENMVIKLDTLYLHRAQDEEMAAQIRGTSNPRCLGRVYAGGDAFARRMAHSATPETVADVFSRYSIQLERAVLDKDARAKAIRRMISQTVGPRPKDHLILKFLDTPGNRRCVAELSALVPDPLNVNVPAKRDANERGLQGDDGADETSFAIATPSFEGKEPPPMYEPSNVSDGTFGPAPWELKAQGVRMKTEDGSVDLREYAPRSGVDAADAQFGDGW